MNEMVGRKVRTAFGELGTVTDWEPLGAGMTDTRVEHADGKAVWWSSTGLTPVDGKGPLPSREEARREADVERKRSLTAIRAQLVAEWHKPWPGAEHGKVTIGKSINGALEALE